jgi:proteasome lid subunit RPN8/RPN11
MKLSQQLLHRIHQHLEKGYPNEACGVMLGQNGTVSEAIPADNQRAEVPATGHESARNRYLIDPLIYLMIEREADERKLQVLGIYHSHPDVAAKPSKFDLDHAWPDFSYLIISVVKGKAVESNSWRLRDDRSAFDQEAVEILG